MTAIVDQAVRPPMLISQGLQMIMVWYLYDLRRPDTGFLQVVWPDNVLWGRVSKRYVNRGVQVTPESVSPGLGLCHFVSAAGNLELDETEKVLDVK
jgi:hypothetical protein